MREKRQNRIMELISGMEPYTQSDITRILQQEGYEITQATVSRDMRDLHLKKVKTDVKGKHRYVVTEDTEQARFNALRLNIAISSAIVDVKYAQNNVVIKTAPGAAQIVANKIDSIKHDNILGCVAGDDTIIVVVSDNEAAAQISQIITELYKSC